MRRLPVELPDLRPYVIVNRLVIVIYLQFTIRVVSNSKDVAWTKIDLVDVFVHGLIVVALDAELARFICIAWDLGLQDAIYSISKLMKFFIVTSEQIHRADEGVSPWLDVGPLAVFHVLDTSK